mmetsp:Transcript_4969/g.11505  ORF Transcript_4969/g.11505 Transcript_4969/m.11505 type:complete len:289 (-) Transcript_4969:1159-2025(-)
MRFVLDRPNVFFPVGFVCSGWLSHHGSLRLRCVCICVAFASRLRLRLRRRGQSVLLQQNLEQLLLLLLLKIVRVGQAGRSGGHRGCALLLVNAAAGGGVPQCGRRRSLLGQLHEIRGGTVGGGKPAGGVRAELLLLLLLNLLLGGRWRRVRADKGTTRKERGRELQLHLLLNLLLDVLLLGLRLLLHLGLLLEISLEQEGDQVLGGHGGGRDNAVGIAAVVVVGDGSTGRGDRGGRHLELLWRKLLLRHHLRRLLLLLLLLLPLPPRPNIFLSRNSIEFSSSLLLWSL